MRTSYVFGSFSTVTLRENGEFVFYLRSPYANFMSFLFGRLEFMVCWRKGVHINWEIRYRDGEDSLKKYVYTLSPHYALYMHMLNTKFREAIFSLA